MANDYNLEDAVAQAFQTIMNIVETDIAESNKNSAQAEKGAAQLLGDMCELTPKDVILRGGFYLVQLLKVDVRNNTELLNLALMFLYWIQSIYLPLRAFPFEVLAVSGPVICCDT